MQAYTLKEIQEFVRENSDEKYRDFHSKLTRTNYFINGIRIPVLRNYAKDIAKDRDLTNFFAEKSTCYEQCMLKGILLSHVKIDGCKFFSILEKYIEEIDDWALVDSACTGIHRKDDLYLSKIIEYASYDNIWFARWGIVAILVNFTDKDEVIYRVVDKLIAKDYYVDMALAWLIQVLAVKNRQVAINLMQSDKINLQVKKFAVRKIKDSFRISQEEKEHFEHLIKR